MNVQPPLPLELLLVLFAALFVGGLLLAWRASARLPSGLRYLAVGCRGLALLALGVLALNIGAWRKPEAGARPRWCVLVDRSASMAEADAGGGSRWAAALGLASRLEREAGERRGVELYTFGETLEAERRSAAALAGVAADGRATGIGRALEAVAGVAAGGDRPVGIVLLSDGRETERESDPARAGLHARALDAPVLAVPFGQVKEARDLSVRVLRRSVVGFAGQPARVQGEVASRWPTEASVAALLVDGAGAAVATNQVRLPAGGRAPVAFTVTPARPGSASYALRVAPWEGESDVRNNEAPFEVTALDKKIRVLLIEGVPFWDSKFLGQLLRRQPNLEVTSVSRTAPERFFVTAPDGASLPEAKAVFPDGASALGAYDLVVFGKGAEYVMTPGRVAALKAFVAEQGGSVVFARGKPYADEGGGLEELEPVRWAGASSVECRFAPRAEGEDAGLFAGLLPGRDDAVWARLPPVACSQASAELKSFAQVLAEGRRSGSAEGAGQAVPLLVSRRFGKGLTVVMNVDGLWQWSFFPSSKEAAEMYEELWSHLLLWAGTCAEFLPGHAYALRLGAASAPPGRPVRVEVRLRGRGAGARDAPAVRVLRGAELVQELALAPGEREESWEATAALDEPGLYRLAVVPPSGDAARAELGGLLQIQAPPGERDEVNPDRGYLEKLAAASGGAVLAPEALDEAMARRERERAKPSDAGSNAVWEPRWDRGWLLAAVLAVLGLEWAVRRRNGLV